MKKRKKSKEEQQKTKILFTIFLITLLIIVILLVIAKTPSKEEKALEKEGYTTTEEDAFYKKVVTNNTLDEYYEDVSNNKTSQYEEYFFSKESYQLIELKLTNSESGNTTLNITSDLRTNEVYFNYELSYESSHMILEGSSNDNYSCKVVVQKDVNGQIITDHCNYIMEEITIFLQRKEELLQNSKIKEIVNQPIKEYVEE